MAVSRSGEYVGIKNKRKLHIWKVPVKDFSYNEIKKIKLHHTKNLSTLAFHPSERLVAGGDVTGRILLWKGFGRRKFADTGHKFSKYMSEDDEEKPGVRGDDDAELSSTWHWHPAEVKFLSFSSDGAYLYSGRYTHMIKFLFSTFLWNQRLNTWPSESHYWGTTLIMDLSFL